MYDFCTYGHGGRRGKIYNTKAYDRAEDAGFRADMESAPTEDGGNGRRTRRCAPTIHKKIHRFPKKTVDFDNICVYNAFTN